MSRLPRTALLRPAPPPAAPAPAAPAGDAVLAWMQSLSDPTRLRLLRLVEQHELGVAELCEILQLPQSTVSRHLKVLADTGWVVSRRESTTHLYHTLLDELDPPKRDLWLLARRQTDGWATAQQDDLRLRQLLAARAEGRGFFEGISAEWEDIRAEQYGASFDLAAAFALLPGDATIADLGCGTGRTVRDLAPHVKRVIGVDASGQMLKAARKRLGGVKNVELRQGELAALPIADATCDAALCVLALSYVEDPAAVVREMARILKPGGRAVIVDLLAHDRDDFRRLMGQRHRGFRPPHVEHLLAAAGLSAARIHPVPPESEAKGPALFVAASNKDA